VGLLVFRRRARSFVGAFCVGKKDKHSLRLVLDARRTNWCHRRAPYAPLSSAGACAVIDLSHLVGDADAQPCGAGADLQDGFYQFGWAEMAEWFAFKHVVRAGDFGVTWLPADSDFSAGPVDEDTLLWPCFAALVMGWSWALFLCHSSLTSAMLRAG